MDGNAPNRDHKSLLRVSQSVDDRRGRMVDCKSEDCGEAAAGGRRGGLVSTCEIEPLRQKPSASRLAGCFDQETKASRAQSSPCDEFLLPNHRHSQLHYALSLFPANWWHLRYLMYQ